MRDGWAAGDAWWRIGAPAVALARVGAADGGAGSPAVREVVALADDGPALEAALATLAHHVGRRFTIAPRRAPLPWRAV
jgi:hypothetical protein